MNYLKELIQSHRDRRHCLVVFEPDHGDFNVDEVIAFPVGEMRTALRQYFNRWFDQGWTVVLIGNTSYHSIGDMNQVIDRLGMGDMLFYRLVNPSKDLMVFRQLQPCANFKWCS